MIEAGEYRGTVLEASIGEKEGGAPYALIKARPDGINENVSWFGSFSQTIISTGRNQGKKVGDQTAEVIGGFGVTDFTKINALEGRPCIFGVKVETWEGKLQAKISYIRPPGNAKAASPASIAGLNAFRASAIEAAKSAPKPDVAAPTAAAVGGGSSGGDDDIPF